MNLENFDHFMPSSFQDLMTFTYGFCALIIVIVGFYRYNKEQQWKRKEFVAKEIKEFYKNKMDRNAMLILDWSTRNIELYPENPDYEKRHVLVRRQDLERALLPHHKLTIQFSNDEIIIRDTFDHFLTTLTRFEHFIETGLVSVKDFTPYLRYWIDAIAEDMPVQARNVLHQYIVAYEYTGVLKLFKRFGKEIKPTITNEEIIN